MSWAFRGLVVAGYLLLALGVTVLVLSQLIPVLWYLLRGAANVLAMVGVIAGVAAIVYGLARKYVTDGK